MPKVVNHEVRRLELLDAVWRVIAREGVEGTTIRAIAVETGWSTGVLQHYFASKRDILLAAHELAYARVAARIQRYRESSAIDALRNAIGQALPLDAARIVEAKIEVAAWGIALADPSFATLKRKNTDTWRASLLKFVTAARAEGSVVIDLDDETLVHEILVLVDGLSAQAALHPALASTERQYALLEALMARMRATAGAAQS